MRFPDVSVSGSANGGGSRGFTILEVVVASGLLVVLAAAMLAVLRVVVVGWSGSVQRMALDQEARMVLDLVAEDLSGLVRSDGTWLAAIPREASAGVFWELRFYSTAYDRDRSSPGDVNAVIYHRGSGEGGSPGHRFHRAVVESVSVFEDWLPEVNALEWPVNRFYDDASDPRETLLASGVLDFEVRFPVLGTSGAIEGYFPVDDDGVLRFGGMPVSGAGPRYATVRLTLLSGEGRRVVATGAPPPIQELRRRYGAVYHRLIVLR